MNDNLDKMISPAVKRLDKRFDNELKRYIERYIDSNSEVLSCHIPLYRLLYNDKRRNSIINMTGINTVALKNARNVIDKDSKVTKPIFYELVSTPYNLLMIELIKRYHANKDEKMLNLVVMELALSFYSVIHPKYYRYLPNPDIMEYTISRVTTKFTFKIHKTMLASIRHLAFTNHNSQIKDLLQNGDSGALSYLASLNSRINNVMKIFCAEYMKDFEEKNAIFSQKDNTDSENFILTTNLSGTIRSNTESCTTDFFTSGVNRKIVDLAAKQAKVNSNLLEQSITLMKERQAIDVENVIRNVIVTFLNDSANRENELGSTKFVLFSMRIYSKSNTVVKSINEIKDSLDRLLQSTMTSYKRCEREATKQSYRKALYYYIVLSMQKSIR